MKKSNETYVSHDCRNSRNPENIVVVVNGKKVLRPNSDYCNNRWIDKDLTKSTTLAPSWKYCKECCEKLGIDFDNQKPSNYRTDEQNDKLKKNLVKMLEKKKSKC